MAVKKRFRMHDSAFIDTSIIRHFLLNTLPQFKKISFPTPNESFVIIAIEVSIFHYISSSFGRPIMWWKMNFLKTKISQNLIYKLMKIYGLVVIKLWKNNEQIWNVRSGEWFYSFIIKKFRPNSETFFIEGLKLFVLSKHDYNREISCNCKIIVSINLIWFLRPQHIWGSTI